MQFIFSRRFKKQLARLPIKIRRVAKDRIHILSQDQHHIVLNNHKLAGEYADCSSINITGDYRIVFQIIDDGVCYLVAIGTHSQLYE